MLLTAVPFLRRMTWRLPDTYHSAGHGRGTATLKFYEGRDILGITLKCAIRRPCDPRPAAPASNPRVCPETALQGCSISTAADLLSLSARAVLYPSTVAGSRLNGSTYSAGSDLGER